MNQPDIIIIGGSAMGSAAAFHLAELAPQLAVRVYEPDPTYEFASTLRSDGNVRIQFGLEVNIRMSQYTFDLLDDFATRFRDDDWAPDPAPRHQGNLFLASAEDVAAAKAGMKLQQELGCDVEWLEPDSIAARWPAYSPQGAVGATFAQADGTVDPAAVLHGLRRAARSRGVEYVAAQVVAISHDGDRVTGVRLADGSAVAADVVINCAGGWATPLMATLGIELPVTPVMRTVYTVESTLPAEGLPLAFTPSGAYIMPEGGTSFSMAWSRESDPVGFDFTFSRAGFEDIVWPEVVAHFPAFNQLRVTGGWTGIYAVNTFDGNAILGEWPTVAGCFVATGFTGHGFQHTPAMGRYLAELITATNPTLDLSPLAPDRLIEGRPLLEHAGRII